MANTIEIAKSGRATCRLCRKPIAKGEYRFGVETVNQFGDGGDASYMWHHMKCGAQKHPSELREALATFEGELPDRAEIDATIDEAIAKKPPPFPHGDRAPTGRARCQACGEGLAKGELRVAVEREIERGASVMKGAGYLHPACAAAFVESQGGSHEELTKGIRENSRSLSAEDLEKLLAEV